MLRMFVLCKRKTAAPQLKQFQGNKNKDAETTHDYDDSVSLSSNLAENNPLPTYQTHSFQQRFHKDHPAPGAKLETFSSFMNRAASSLPAPDTDVAEQAPQTSWWSFDRDYDEKKEADEHEEEEGVDDFASRNESSPMRAASPTHFKEESKGDSFDDGFYGFGGEGITSHLFAQHTIIRTDVQDLGSRNVLYHRQGEDIDDDVESIASESSDDFQPRLQASEHEDRNAIDAKNNAPFEQDFSHSNHFRTFLQNAPVRPPEKTTCMEKCFENILLLSPAYFDTLEEATATEKGKRQREQQQDSKKSTTPPSSPSLSNMVYPMNLDLFAAIPEDEFKRQPAKQKADHSVSTFGSTTPTGTPLTNRKSGTVFHMDQYTLPVKTSMFETIRKKLASSFRSKASGSKNRVTYSLSKGKGGMTKKERIYSRSLLPARPLLSQREQRESSTSTRIPRSILYACDRPLSILLLNPVLKIFEIVLVDFLKDTTVGDALSKARSNAMDEALSEQKYVSLCNRKQELAAPMLPVSLLVDSQRSNKWRGSSGDLSDEDCEDQMNRREMEARLLVAVPEGSTAFTCQAIRRMLWKNPKLQRWWKQTDPFNCPCDHLEDDESVPELKKKITLRKQHKNVKYQPLDPEFPWRRINV